MYLFIFQAGMFGISATSCFWRGKPFAAGLQACFGEKSDLQLGCKSVLARKVICSRVASLFWREK
ncbi:hypothetical protein B5F77_11415 [Parabacteroides sp. An277]|nr:hypothetical protein B5F77_11415 [Parabacteroides sp. An277]